MENGIVVSPIWFITAVMMAFIGLPLSFVVGRELVGRCLHYSRPWQFTSWTLGILSPVSIVAIAIAPAITYSIANLIK